MPTSEQKWIADEVMLYCNKIHDSLDAVRILLKGYNPNSWTGEFHKLSPVDLRDAIKSFAQAARNNYGFLSEFIDAYGLHNVAAAMTSCGYDAQILKTKIEDMKNHADWILSNADTAKSADAITYLDSNVPAFAKVARRWAIGL